jgi:glucokinase
MAENLGRTLLGDVGGTNARFALLESGKMTPIESTLVADYSDIRLAMSRFFIIHQGQRPITSAILAVAGPVEADRCKLTNSSWVVDGTELRKAFDLTTVRVVNDFEAIAWALLRLSPNDLFTIGSGKPVPGAPAAVLGAGTALGLACLVARPDGAFVVGTEGGHATLPGMSAREDAVIAHLRHRFGHVSLERALSGAGLENLYGAIKAIDRVTVPDRSAAEITKIAISGGCRVCVAALDMFCAMLGTMAGNVALMFGARGGIYIAGGIAPRIINYLKKSEFRARVEAKGRFRAYLAAVPTNVIIHPDPAFVGLQVFAERQFSA